MTGVRRVVANPTAVLDAVNLETGEHALILTTPIDVKREPHFLDLLYRTHDAPIPIRGR